MRINRVRVVIGIVIIAMVLMAAGCEQEAIITPILPGQAAVLVITFTPSPVYQGYGDRYRFTVFIDEVNGVGARITSMKVEHVDDEGIVIDKDDYNESAIIQRFGTSRIEPYGRLMANVELQCDGCDRESWLLRADDDFGNHVEYSQSVELIPR